MEYLRHIPLENIQNCRDLGGYPIMGGGATKFGRLLRCGIPKRPTQSDMQFLREYGIKTVFDLRGDMEATKMPSAFISEPGVEYYQLSLLEINPAVPRVGLTMPEIYLISINDCRDNIAALFSHLAALKEPALFHCFLGKDRTGITAALILYLNDVFFEDIVADYRISATYLEPFYQREIEMDSGLIWEDNRDNLDSKPENILTVFDYLKRRFGSVQDYLLSSGVTVQEIDAVSELLR